MDIVIPIDVGIIVNKISAQIELRGRSDALINKGVYEQASLDHVKIFSVNTPGRTSLLLCQPSVILIGCGSAKSKELVNQVFQYLDYILVMARYYFWTSVVVCIWTLGISIMDSQEGAGLNLQVQKRRTLNYNLRPLKGDIMCIFSLIQRSYFIYHLFINKWKLKKTYLESALVVISLMFFYLSSGCG